MKNTNAKKSSGARIAIGEAKLMENVQIVMAFATETDMYKMISFVLMGKSELIKRQQLQ